jgi:hypothetical protein
MGAVTFLTARFLDSRNSGAWVRTRAASEGLKREAYRAAAQAAPYDDPSTSGRKLGEEVQRIETDVKDLIGEQPSKASSSTPVQVIPPADYIKMRVDDQVRFYEERAGTYRAASTRLRRIELVLALTTALITAVVGLLEKPPVGGFDWISLTAVLTTLSGSIVAYIEASRYDFIVASYRAAAARLRALSATVADNVANIVVPSAAWSAFVEQAESILQAENTAWIAKFSKAEKPG